MSEKTPDFTPDDATSASNAQLELASAEMHADIRSFLIKTTLLHSALLLACLAYTEGVVQSASMGVIILSVIYQFETLESKHADLESIQDNF